MNGCAGRIGGLAVALGLGLGWGASHGNAQIVSIPVTNGNFALTRQTNGAYVYTTLPTFLTPAGTISITAGPANQAGFQSLIPITTNTPAGAFLPGLSGSVSLTDGRTGTFTGDGFATVRGLATATVASSGAPTTYTPTVDPGTYNRNFVRDTTVTFTVQSGAMHVPAASLSAYPVPQFTLPVAGGSFTVEDAPGTGHATLTINGLLTPGGTTNLTLALPAFTRRDLGIRYLAQDVERQVEISGLASGTIALSDGRTATVTNRLVTLQGTAKRTSPGENYLFHVAMRDQPSTLTGQFTGGAISIPAADLVAPPIAVPQPPIAPLRPEPVVRAGAEPVATLPPAIAPPMAPPVFPGPEIALQFAVNVNLGDEAAALRQQWIPTPTLRDRRTEDEDASPLHISRVHGGLSAP